MWCNCALPDSYGPPIYLQCRHKEVERFSPFRRCQFFLLIWWFGFAFLFPISHTYTYTNNNNQNVKGQNINKNKRTKKKKKKEEEEIKNSMKSSLYLFSTAKSTILLLNKSYWSRIKERNLLQKSPPARLLVWNLEKWYEKTQINFLDRIHNLGFIESLGRLMYV